MPYQWCVITKAENVEGNRALPEASILEEVAKVFEVDPIQVILKLRGPVFHTGEIFLIGSDGREVGWSRRKPSKWDVEFKLFELEEVADAVSLAVKVTQ